MNGDDDVIARRARERAEVHAMSASKLVRLSLRCVVRVTGVRDRIQSKPERQSDEQCS